MSRPPFTRPTMTACRPEHRAFCLARQAMNERFLAWLRADPTADFDSEIEPTLDVLRQLRALEQMP